MHLLVNSNTDRQPGGTSSKFQLNFSQAIDTGYDGKLGVFECTVPYTCSQFSDETNTFWIIHIDVGELIGLQIDNSKFYDTMTDVCNELKSLSDLYSLDLNFKYVNDRVQIINNSAFNIRPLSSLEFESTWDTNKIFLNGQQVHGFNGPFNQMQTKLGFISDYTNTVVAPSASITSSGLPKLSRTSCFYLCSDVVSDYMITNSIYESHPIICKIPLQGNFGTLSTYTSTSTEPIYFSINESNIDYINFYLLDDDMAEIDLNGHPLTFHLEIKKY